MVGFLAGVAGGATVSIVIKAIDEYSKNLTNAQKRMQAFKTAAVAVGTVAAAAFAKFTVEAVRAGMAMKPMRDSFNSLTVASDKYLFELTNATKGTVSNFELMSNANKALLLGLDQEALPQLFRNAAIVGRAAGRSTTEAIQDITLGIGRQSRLILDNLGIIIKAENVYKDYAESIGKTTSELTAQEKQLAFNIAAQDALNVSAEKISGGSLEIPEDTITSVQRLASAWDNFKTSLGEAYTDGIAKILPKADNDMTSFGQRIGAILSFITNAFVITFRTIGLGVRSWVHLLSLGITAVLRARDKALTALGIPHEVTGEDFMKFTLQQGKEIERVVDELSSLGSDMGQQFKDINRMQTTTKETEKQADAVQETVENLTEVERLVKRLSGFRHNPYSGDVFNPESFNANEFKTRSAYEWAFDALTKGEKAGYEITIENIYGIDPKEISEALGEEINLKLSTG